MLTRCGLREPTRAAAVWARAFMALALCLVAPLAARAIDNASSLVSANLIKEDLYDTDFVSPLKGWAVGTFGSVFYTDNGGQTWEKQPTGVMVPLFSVSFADARHGWVVGKAGTILYTPDGGQTWRQQPSAVDRHLFAVEAVSPTIAWAVGDWGKIQTTSDGGVTWEDRSLDEDLILYGIDFADEQYGWIAGEVGNLMVTEDGGKTWARQTPTETSFFGIHVADREHASAVGLDGQIWQFGGGQWEKRSSGVTFALYDVAMDGNKGWVVGDYGTALTTEDGGETWQAVEVPDDLKLFWMHTVSLTPASGAGQGLIAGANGLMLWIREGRVSPK